MTEGTTFATELRRRIEFEDELLNSRTTIFLGINGLWAAVVGVSSEAGLQIGIAILGFVVTGMWLLCAWQSLMVIRELTRKLISLSTEYQDSFEKRVDTLVREALGKARVPHLLRPTIILAVGLPGFSLVSWLLFLFLAVWSA